MKRILPQDKICFKAILIAVITSFLSPAPVLLGETALRPLSTFEKSDKQRLDVVGEDARFYYTYHGAMIGKEVDLTKVRARPEDIANSLITGKNTVIEEGAILQACDAHDVYAKAGSTAHASILRTKWPPEDEEFETWKYNERYKAQGGQMTLGKGVTVAFSTLTNVVTDNNEGNDKTGIVYSSFQDSRVGARNSFKYLKAAYPFHTEHDVTIEGDKDSPVELGGEAWFGWGFIHRREMNIGGQKFSRPPQAYLEGVYPNEIVTVKLDESGEPVKALDADGKPIVMKDALGGEVKKADGKPLYKYEYRVWKDIPATAVIGYNTIMASYDGKLRLPKSGRIPGITGKKMPDTEEREGSEHYHYLFEPFSVMCPGEDVNGVRVIGLSGHPDELTEVYNRGDVTAVTSCSMVGGRAENKTDSREHWAVSHGRSTGLSPIKDVPAFLWTFAPQLIRAFGAHIRYWYYRRGWPLNKTNGLFEAILATHEVNVLHGGGYYNMHRKSKAWRYEDGGFVNWKGEGEALSCPGYDGIFEGASRASDNPEADSIYGGADGVQKLLGNSTPEKVAHQTIIPSNYLNQFADKGQRDSQVAETAKIGKNVSISPTNVVIENDVILEDGVVIGPNVHLKKGTHVKANTVVTFADIGEGTRLGENCSLSFLITDPTYTIETLWDKKPEQVSIGDGSSLTNSYLKCVSTGRETKADRVRYVNSTFGDRNTGEPWAQVSGAEYGDQNIIGGRVFSLRGSPHGTVMHHLSSVIVYAVVPHVFGAPNQTNFSAACVVFGSADKPVNIEGAFIGANCSVGKGSSIAGFAKNRVPTDTTVGHFDFYDGEKIRPGELLTYKFGFPFLTRHGLSKIKMVIPRDEAHEQKLANADRVLESKACEDIRRHLERISGNAGLHSTVIVTIDALINSVQGDLTKPGQCSDIANRMCLVRSALDVLIANKGDFRKPEELLAYKGLYRNILMLVECLRMRDDRFTEGEPVVIGPIAQIGKFSSLRLVVWKPNKVSAKAVSDGKGLKLKHLLEDPEVGIQLINLVEPGQEDVADTAEKVLLSVLDDLNLEVLGEESAATSPQPSLDDARLRRGHSSSI